MQLIVIDTYFKTNVFIEEAWSTLQRRKLRANYNQANSKQLEKEAKPKNANLKKEEKEASFPQSKRLFLSHQSFSFSLTCTTFYSFSSLSLSLTLSYLLCSQAHTGKRTCSQSWLCNRTEHLIDPNTNESTHRFFTFSNSPQTPS